MRTRGGAAVLALAVTVLPACTRTTTEEKAQQVAVGPYLNVIAKRAAELPSVDCALALLPDGGIPGGAQSDIITVAVNVDLPLDDPLADELLREVGALVWRSPLPVLQLTVTTFGGLTLGPDGRRAAEAGNALDVDQLTALYGPRPTLPSTLPPVQDPGAQRC